MGVWGNNGETVVALDLEHALVLMKTHSTLRDFDTYTFLMRHEDIFQLGHVDGLR